MRLPEAQDIPASLLEQPEHSFWPAVANGGVLATFDRAVLALPGAKTNVEMILSQTRLCYFPANFAIIRMSADYSR
jgi:hypothetical protein